MMGFFIVMGFFAMGFIRNTWIALLFFSIVATAVIANLMLMQNNQRAERRPPVIRSTAPTNIAQEHALKAARLAGINPETARVLPIDIGMVGLRAKKATLYRVWHIDDDVDTVQPFINLRVKQFAHGTLRFEIYDDADELCFSLSGNMI